MKPLLFLAFSAFTILASCGMKDDITKKDSPTTGKLRLFYDEGLKLHIENQVFTFKATYKYADISTVCSNEKDCIEALYNDSCKAIAITRLLTDKEMQQFKARNIYPEASVVAGDAIAFIVPLSFPDSAISVATIRDLLLGNDSAYISGKHIRLVFDNANSGSVRHLKDSLIPNRTFGKNCSAASSTPELIGAISESANSIGVCDYAWLSDKDDSVTKGFLKKVKILAVSRQNSALAYMPDQSNIATHDYPFCRSVCIIRRSPEFSLGKGIETFIAGEKGQLMFLKQGLPPNRQEERVIEVDMTPLGSR